MPKELSAIQINTCNSHKHSPCACSQTAEQVSNQVRQLTNGRVRNSTAGRNRPAQVSGGTRERSGSQVGDFFLKKAIIVQSNGGDKTEAESKVIFR